MGADESGSSSGADDPGQLPQRDGSSRRPETPLHFAQLRTRRVLPASRAGILLPQAQATVTTDGGDGPEEAGPSAPEDRARRRVCLSGSRPKRCGALTAFTAEPDIVGAADRLRMRQERRAVDLTLRRPLLGCL